MGIKRLIRVLVTLLMMYIFVWWKVHKTFEQVVPGHDRVQRHTIASKTLSVNEPVLQLSRDESKTYGAFLDSRGALKDYKDDEYAITLLTHGTLSRLPALIETATHWRGAISAAIFLGLPDTAMIDLAAKLIELFRECTLTENVDLHLVVPNSIISNSGILDLVKRRDSIAISQVPSFLSCTDTAAQMINRIKDALSEQNYNLTVPYPNNALRNFARMGSKTAYSMSLDIDMVPLPISLQHDFQTFMQVEKSRHSIQGAPIAYVLPAFELMKNKPIPVSVDAVQEQFNDSVRPFYFDPCWKCQRYTNYSRWLNQNAQESVYDVAYHDPWEPFYIAKTDWIPYFDERFLQYGFNRISQICAMHMKGFTFRVLKFGYLIHRGFKKRDGFHPQKQAEQDRNRMIFRRLKEELKTEYPGNRRCNLAGRHV